MFLNVQLSIEQNYESAKIGYVYFEENCNAGKILNKLIKNKQFIKKS